MTSRAIDTARRLCRQYRSRDPFRIAQEEDICILPRFDFVEQKGAFCIVEDFPFIMLNGNLPEQEQKTVCAHELGHALLHREIAEKGALCEFDLFNMATDVEYEANVFASELLIDTRDLKECLEEGLDIYAAAGELGVNLNLLIIKLAELNRRGSKYNLPYLPDKGFLGE